MKRFALLLILSSFSISVFPESIRYKVDGYEFYFLKDQGVSSASQSQEIVGRFADQFISELINESERLNLKRPFEAFVFIAENSKVFSTATGQPSFVAARFLSESNRFYFQNPKTLEKRNILTSTIRHEICHFLSPHLENENFRWLEESYCEALYPTNTIVPKRFLAFPKTWDEFKKTYSNQSSKKQVTSQKYKLLAAWGAWILKEHGETQFRNLLNRQSPETKWKLLYSNFLKSE
ncbi:hypothetical protein JQK62_00835 [Leptospira santarosai]|nr:hypothetical protein [Leptospira santarosai]